MKQRRVSSIAGAVLVAGAAHAAGGQWVVVDLGTTALAYDVTELAMAPDGTAEVSFVIWEAEQVEIGADRWRWSETLASVDCVAADILVAEVATYTEAGDLVATTLVEPEWSPPPDSGPLRVVYDATCGGAVPAPAFRAGSLDEVVERLLQEASAKRT